MKFWDSSALVPLLIEEQRSRACRQALRADPRQLVWCLSRTEVVSALCRREREKSLDSKAVRVALTRLDRLAERWTEVDAISLARDGAERLLRVHPLRAADALQLASALLAFDGRPRARVFVSLDRVLLDAAEREGFDILEPTHQ